MATALTVSTLAPVASVDAAGRQDPVADQADPTQPASGTDAPADPQPTATTTTTTPPDATDPTPSPTVPDADRPAPPPSGGTDVPVPPLAALESLGESTIGVTKTVSRNALEPGDELEYTIVASCSSLTEPCVDFTVSDTLPAEFDVTSIPPSNSERVVTYDPATRLLRVVYQRSLGGGQTGLPAGSSQSVRVGMRLPTQTAVTDGTVIPNTAEVTASNADPATSTAQVTAQIPVSLQPVATKVWSPAAGLAQSGARSTVTVGARNASTSSSQVRELAVADIAPGTFDRFDLISVGTLDRFPSGADQVVVELCPLPIGSTCGLADWVASPPQSGPVPLTLTPPAGVTLSDATGVRYRWSNSGGGDLAFDIDDARVAFEVELRDALRGTGEPLNPVTAQRVDNCATPAVTTASSSAAVGPDACAGYVIQPGNASVGATKDIFADSNGDYSADGNVVVGQDSGVSMKVTATNNSSYPVPIIAITEPSASAASEFDKLDITTARVNFPAGAQRATLTVTCRTGADPAPVLLTSPPVTQSRTSLGCAPGVFPESVRVEFVGLESDGQTPTIPAKAAGSLELHGTASGVDTQDVVDGLLNCADTFIASQPDSTGASAATACDTQPVQNPRPSVGGGTKSSTGVSTIVPGQELDFSLSFRNNGNIPVSNVVLVDPPDPTASTNPFNVVRLTRLAATTASPASTLEVFDPVAGAYVAYVGSDAALLQRATGIRVRVTGNLSPGQTFRVGYSVLLRDDQPTGITFRNCASVGLDTPTSSPFCNGSDVTATTPGTGGSINKSIVPGTVVRPQPGLAPQVITVRHAIQNTGSLYLKQLGLTDVDADFFDAVTFTGNLRVNFPNGANRVRVDVCTSTAACASNTFVNGTATSSQTPGIPAGVTAADVKGVRITFTNSNGGYEILPSPNLPTGGRCPNASVCFDATVRQFLASSPTTPVPDVLEDTTGGFGESELQAPGSTFTIPDVDATVAVVQGTPSLAVVKTPNSRIGPGDTAPFSITVTNSGTDAVVDPVVVDPLPAGLTFDPVTPGAPPGQAYTVQYVLPTGVSEPSSVDFTTVNGGVPPPVTGCTDPNRVCRLAWSFPGFALPPGAKIILGFTVRLSPGVVAGQTVTNTAGASGSDPRLTCTSPTSATDDPNFGPGLFCTGSANIVTLAGDDFLAEKWIAADPALGLLDAAGQPVPLNSSACPRYADGTTVYTRFPCTARVLPGQAIDYLIRGVNSGTNPASEIVLVDGLPVQGDTGVLLSGQQRGTQWNNRPTMLTPVSGVGDTGQIQTDYTNATFPGSSFCTANLQPPPGDTCPSGSFAAGFGPGNTGFRTRLTFPDGDRLLPGETFTLTWRMQAPLSLTSTSNEPVAWNSFAYRPSFVLPGGATTVLPATEPLKVGVSMPLGSFRVTKAVVGLPPNIPLAPFGVAWSCSIDSADGSSTEVGSGTFTLVDGGVFTSPNIGQGATCRVWETDAQGGQSPNIGESSAATVVIDGSTGPQTVALTNAYDTGSLTLSKAVRWDAVPPIDLPGPFAFQITCAFPTIGDILPGFPRSVDLAEGASTTIDDLPVGTICGAAETDTVGAIEIEWASNNGGLFAPTGAIVGVAPDSGGGTQLDAENVYTTGGVRITKVLTGPASQWSQGPFVFEVACSDPNGVLPPITETVTLGPAQLVGVVSPVPTGYECTTTETDTGDSGGSTVTPVEAQVIPPYVEGEEPPGPVEVSSTNDFPAGSVSIAKVLAGDAAGPMAGAEFTIRVRCERDLVGVASPNNVQVFLDETFTLRGGETATSDEPLPIGARCWADELDSVGATGISITNDESNKATITDAAPDLTITATNTYTPGGSLVGENDSGIRITKTLTGSAAAFAQGPFRFETVCSLGGFTLPTYPVTELTPDDLVGYVNPIPVGAECTVTEIGNGGAAGPVPVVVGEVTVPAATEPAVDVAAVNEFPGGSLQITKQVAGAGALLPAATYTLEVTCERDLLAGGTETIVEETVELRGAETTEVATGLPLGTRCWAEETDDGGASAAVVDFDSASNAAEITGAGQVVLLTATNTFESARVTVSKSVTGAAPTEPFGFSLICTFTPPGGTPLPVELAAAGDGSAPPAGTPGSAAVFRLAAGAQRVIEVPVGSQCAAEEFDRRGASVTTVEVTAGRPPLAFAVDGATTVAFTNVFPAAVEGAGDANAGDRLSFTGAESLRLLLAGLALLGLGGLAVVIERRRGARRPT